MLCLTATLGSVLETCSVCQSPAQIRAQALAQLDEARGIRGDLNVQSVQSVQKYADRFRRELLGRVGERRSAPACPDAASVELGERASADQETGVMNLHVTAVI